MESRDLDIKKAYKQLLEFELELHRQESLREKLGSPFGRAPPFKLNLSSIDNKHLSPNYSSSLARHPFLSTFSTDSLPSLSKTPSNLESSRLSTRKAPLQPVIKIVTNTFQESQRLKTQNIQRSILKEYLLNKFPTNIKELIKSLIESETNSEEFYENPQNNPEFNPFLRPKGKNYFFPLEMFYEESLALEDLNYPVKGYCKYNLGDKYEWKPCKILRFNVETGKFFIKWDDKGNIKETSRHTIRFFFEDQNEYDKKIQDAEVYRVNYEAGIRYLARLDIETYKNFDKISISKTQEKRIIRKIGKDLSELLNEDVFEEIRKNYIKGVVEFSFKIEYFINEAKKLEKPWELELKKIEQNRPYINKFRHTDFKATIKRLNKLLGLESPEFSTLKEVINKLAGISELRLYNIIIELSSKKKTYEDKKLKWIAKDWFTEIKIKLDKTIKKSLKFLRQNESISNKYFQISQILFESNLQVSIYKSKQQLQDHIYSFYAVLPDASHDKELLSCFTPDFLEQRAKQRKTLSLYTEDVLGRPTENLAEAIDLLSESLSSQIFSNAYSNNTLLTPMITIQIISSFSLLRQLRGRKFKLFTIQKSLESSGLTMFNLQNLNNIINKRNSVLASNDGDILRTLNNRTKLSKKSRKNPLLIDSQLDWYGASYENFGLYITPTLKVIEEYLRDIIKAPLKSLENIRGIHKKGETDKIFVSNSSECYQELLKDIQNALKYSLLGPISMIKVLGKYNYLVKDSLSTILEDVILDHANDYKSLQKTIKKIQSDTEEAQKFIPTNMNFGILQVDLSMVKLEIVNNGNELITAILEEIEKEKNRLLEQAHLDFDNLIKKLISTPSTVEEFVEIRNYIDKKRDLEDFKPIKNSLDVIDLIIETMEEFKFSKIKDPQEKYWITKSWINKLKESQVLANTLISNLHPYFQSKVKEDVDKLNKNLSTIMKEINDFKKYENIDEAYLYSSMANDIANRLQSFLLESITINSREAILKFDKSNFSNIADMVEDFDKYHKLWQYIENWNEKSMNWMNHPFKLINAKEVEEIIRDCFSLFTAIESKYKNNIILNSISLIMQNKLNMFKKFLPIILCLRDKSIQLRHWKEIWRILKQPDSSGLETYKMENQTLESLLEMHILGHIPQIAEVALKARHEYEIERTLERIDIDLKYRIVVVKYEECDKIEIVKDIHLVLDAIKEHQLNLNFLSKNARYIEYSKGKIADLLASSFKTQLFLEDFSRFQDKWKELYPLFLLPVLIT